MITLFRSRCLYVTLKFIVVIASFSTLNAYSNILDFQTTRLKATGGAGAGSILVDEASVLNPAPLALFNISSIYVQKTSGDVERKNPDGTTTEGSSDVLGFIATDTKGGLKGSVSYAKTEFMNDERSRWSASLAAPTGKQSAFGATYRFTTDKSQRPGAKSKDKYQQAVFGFIQAITPKFTVGLVAVDPFKKRSKDTRGILGFQYVFSDMLALIGDAGADYTKNFSDTLQWNAAIQVKVFSDFFLRVGVFDDEGNKYKGNGIGLGWVQPRLSVDFAFKNIDAKENMIAGYSVDEVKETSFSVSIRW